jgi:hypothetical protein
MAEMSKTLFIFIIMLPLFLLVISVSILFKKTTHHLAKYKNYHLVLFIVYGIFYFYGTLTGKLNGFIIPYGAIVLASMFASYLKLSRAQIKPRK